MAWPSYYQLVLANILAGPLLQLADRLTGLTRPGGQLVLSGILAAQVPDLVAGYARWFDFDARYCRYIAAYNWSSVPNVVLLLGLIGLMAVFGGGPEGRATPLVGLLSVILFFWLIAYHAYIVWIVAAPGKGAAGRGAAGLGLVILLVLGEAMIGEGLISFKNAVIAGG